MDARAGRGQDGVPIGDAAAALGITTAALRKRIRRGTVQAHKRGERWEVVLPVGDGTPLDAGQDAGQDAGLDVAALMRRMAWLEARVEAGETERAELRRMLFVEQQTVAALRQLAPPAGPDMTPATYHPPTTPVAPLRPAGPRRWAFWRRHASPSHAAASEPGAGGVSV